MGGPGPKGLEDVVTKGSEVEAARPLSRRVRMDETSRQNVAPGISTMLDAAEQNPAVGSRIASKTARK